MASWPNGKRVAISVTVMFETYADNASPSYSVQTSSLRPGTPDHAGMAWATYGGRVGVWRLLRLFDELGIGTTFFVNARCTEQYPDAVRQIVRSGHDIAGHGYTQDQLLAYMDAAQQESTIRKCISQLEDCSGSRVTGWVSPVVAFTPETAGCLAKCGLSWTSDVTYADLPHRITTPHGVIAGVPTTDFSDNRVMRSNPRDLIDAHLGTLKYLSEREDMSLLTLVFHCQFGGRPLMTSVIRELLRSMSGFRDIWFATHRELAQWALDSETDEHSYRTRFFP